MEQKEIEKEIKEFFDTEDEYKDEYPFTLGISLMHGDDKGTTFLIDIKTPEDVIKIISAIKIAGYEITDKI